MVILEKRERRHQIVEVSDDRANDQEYFAAIEKEWTTGGKESFYKLLRDRNLEGVNLERDRIHNPAMAEQKRLSWSAEDKWMFQILDEGVIEGDGKAESIIETHDFTEGTNDISSDLMYQSYLQFMNDIKARYKITKRELSIRLRQWCPDMRDERKRVYYKRVVFWILPGLTDCRALWDDDKGGKTKWNE